MALPIAPGSTATQVGPGSSSNRVELQVGTLYTSTIQSGGTNYYRFTADTSETATISLTRLGADMQYTLFSTNGIRIAILTQNDNVGSNGDEIGTTSTALTAGDEYHIDVLSGTDNTDFHLLIEQP